MTNESNKTRLFEKVKIYPCIRRVFLSMQNQLEVGRVLDKHIHLHNETFVVHPNTSTSTNQLKYMVIHSWFYEVWEHKTSSTLPIFIEVFIPSKEVEWSCICVLGVSILPLRFLDEILELFC